MPERPILPAAVLPGLAARDRVAIPAAATGTRRDSVAAGLDLPGDEGAP